MNKTAPVMSSIVKVPVQVSHPYHSCNTDILFRIYLAAGKCSVFTEKTGQASAHPAQFHA